MKDVAEFYAKDRGAWREWLSENHDKESSVWLVYDKGKDRKLTWRDIVQEALCFGWIDSTARPVSESQGKIYISRRRPKSNWSKINKGHVEELVAAGLMTPAGQAAIDEAKRNGSWELLDKTEALEIPPELAKLFAKNPVAAANFDTFSNSSKKMILHWIYSAKRPETKQRRCQQTAELAAQNIKAR